MTIDKRDLIMGDFQLLLSHSHPYFPPINNYTALNSMNITIYRSTAYDNEIIIDGVYNRFCVYAILTGNEFKIDSKETGLRPEDFGYPITPNCPQCPVRLTGSGYFTELQRGDEKPKLYIQYTLSYEGFDLIRYSGSTEYDLPRPLKEANDC